MGGQRLKNILDDQASYPAPGQLSAMEQRAREVAHELNNLAAILSGHIEFIFFEQKLSLELEKELKTIRSLSQNLASLARQLLHPDNSPPKAKKVLTELSTLVQESLQVVSPQLKREGIKLWVIHHQPTISLLLDPDQISQVLLNLYLNAQQAMAKTARKVLSIETGQEAGFALVKVSDTGCGIPIENQARIFYPFFTTKAQQSAEAAGGISGGSGLGLAMAKRIIEDHGGSIKVSSQPGEGTTFTIFLPLNAASAHDNGCCPENDLPPLSTSTKTFRLQGRRILIIDDEPSIRQIIKKALKLQGAKVDAVGAGSDGLRMIRKKNYDLILLDLKLQDMPGEGLLEMINSTLPESARPRKIVMSGAAADSNQGLLSSLGVSAILCKPFELEELYTTISATLRA